MMILSKEMRGDILLLTPQANWIDVREADHFKTLLFEALSEKNYPDTILNLDVVEFLDSSALAIFFSLLKLLRGHGKELAIIGLKPQLKDLFILLNLNQAFKLFDSEKEAEGFFTTIPKL